MGMMVMISGGGCCFFVKKKKCFHWGNGTGGVVNGWFRVKFEFGKTMG